MNKRIKKLWIKALLSGKYKQGNNYLRNKDNTYCCLGVLCAISPWKNTYTIMKPENDSLESNKVLPLKIIKWSKMNSYNGKYNQDRLLTEDNDDGKSFSEIAQIIQDNF